MIIIEFLKKKNEEEIRFLSRLEPEIRVSVFRNRIGITGIWMRRNSLRSR